MKDPRAAVGAIPKSSDITEQTGELCAYIRWPDGSPLNLRRPVSVRQAELLASAGICELIKSPTGIPRYLRMKRNPPVKRFASILAQDNFTVIEGRDGRGHRWTKDGSTVSPIHPYSKEMLRTK
jgi:hypothetical protein